MVITKRKSKQNGMTTTEGKVYLNLLDSISNGKCCRWTAAPTELLWIHLASVCGKYRVEYIDFRATFAERQDVTKYIEW